MEDRSLIAELSSAIKNGKKTVTRRKLLSIPSIKRNPISERLIESFTKDGVFDFEELINELCHFVSASSLGPKLDLLFKLYDRNKQGIISERDLFYMLKLLNGYGLEDNKLWNIVDKTFREVGEYPTGIGLEDFSNLILGRTKNVSLFFKAKKR